MALTNARYFLAGTDSIALGNIHISGSNIINATFSWWMKLDTGAISEGGLRNLFSKQTGNSDQFAVRKSGTNFSIHLQYGGWNQTWTHPLVQDTSWHHYMWAWESPFDHGILYTDGSLTQDTVHADIGYLESQVTRLLVTLGMTQTTRHRVGSPSVTLGFGRTRRFLETLRV